MPTARCAWRNSIVMHFLMLDAIAFAPRRRTVPMPCAARYLDYCCRVTTTKCRCTSAWAGLCNILRAGTALQVPQDTPNRSLPTSRLPDLAKGVFTWPEWHRLAGAA
jgi:hypothetical protein